jgi:hypothetical protein
MLGKRN